jgi:hypothetical protein
MTDHDVSCEDETCCGICVKSARYVHALRADAEYGLDARQIERMADWLTADGWDIRIREPRRGEAEGTYRVGSDGSLQILGFSSQVPDALQYALQYAFEEAIGG